MIIRTVHSLGHGFYGLFQCVCVCVWLCWGLPQSAAFVLIFKWRAQARNVHVRVERGQVEWKKNSFRNSADAGFTSIKDEIQDRTREGMEQSGEGKNEATHMQHKSSSPASPQPSAGIPEKRQKLISQLQLSPPTLKGREKHAGI